MMKTRTKLTTLVWSVLIVLTLCIGLVPMFSMTASAADGDAIDLSTLTETYVISDNGEYTFTGTGNYGIKVESGNPTIILNNANITLTDGDYYGDIPINAIHVGSAGGTTTIQVLGESSITAKAGAGIFVAEGGTVKITGNSLEDALTVTGAQGGSGIGGYVFMDDNHDLFAIDCGNITIDNVTVHAYGTRSTMDDFAPGIGSVCNTTCASIMINNAVVYAYGADSLHDYIGAAAIGSGFTSVGETSTNIPTVIINHSSVHTYRSDPYSDYIGWQGDEYGSTDATGSINCGEGGSITNSTIYCYTIYGNTTDKTVKYGALGGLLKEDGTCEGEHSGGTQTCMGYKCANCANWYGEVAHSTTAEGDKAATCGSKAYCSVCDSEYGEVDADNHTSDTYTNGFRDCCGAYEPADWNETDSVYEIGNLGQLMWFAENAASTKHNVILTADITIDNSVVWKPMTLTDGAANSSIFDGDGHTITFANTNEGSTFGLFGTYNYSFIKNLKLAGSITCNTTGNVGVLVNSAYRTTISNVISTCTITNNATTGGTGGLAGQFGGQNDEAKGLYSLIENCAVYADVIGGGSAGGFIGNIWAGYQFCTLNNCVFVGDSQGTVNSGAIVGSNGNNSSTTSTFTNVYYCEKDGIGWIGSKGSGKTSITNMEAKTAEQFASGEVAYLLGTAWGQDLTTAGTYPIPGGTPVTERCDFFGQQLNLGADLAMKYYVAAYGEGFNGELLKVEFIFLGERKEVSGEYDPTTGLYLFILEGITPQCMGDNIYAKLYYGDDVKDTKDEYSVEENLNNLLVEYAHDAALVTLINDTLAYGEAASAYKKHQTMTGKDYTENGSDRELPDTIVVANNVFRGYTVVFGQQNYIKIKVNLGDNDKLYLNGEDVTAQLEKENASDTYQLYRTAGIAATDFATVFEFKVHILGDPLIQTFSVSVNDYIGAKKDSETMGNLVKALYNYGISATGYANCKAGIHDWDNGACKHCKLVCTHNWNNGICAVCELVCEHDWYISTCTICELVCEHEEVTDPSYTWEFNNSSCTATAECDKCGKDISETVDAVLDKTPDNNGYYSRRVTFTNSAFEEQSKLSYQVKDNTYYVYDSDGLLAWNKAAQTDLALNLTLMADIDMSDAGKWTPIGDSNNPYTGIIDGNDRTVSYILLSDLNDGNGSVYVGFVGQMSGGEMKDICLDSPEIDMPESFDEYACVYVGIIGNLYSGTMTNVSVTGNVAWNVSNGGFYNFIGVLVGYTATSTGVQNCHVEDGIILYVYLDAECYVGGIVGYNMGRVSECTSGVDINAEILSGGVGGVAGWYYEGISEILDCEYYGDLNAAIASD